MIPQWTVLVPILNKLIAPHRTTVPQNSTQRPINANEPSTGVLSTPSSIGNSSDDLYDKMEQAIENAKGSPNADCKATEVTQKCPLAAKEKKYDISDAEKGIQKVASVYGNSMAKNVEKMYRLETSHFKSLQYMKTGTGGMEASGNGKPPYYGWGSLEAFTEKYPEYAPAGTIDMKEGKGLSEVGGNKQITSKSKTYIVMPSVEAGMMFMAHTINSRGGDPGTWHSTEEAAQEAYTKSLKYIKSDISDKLPIEVDYDPKKLSNIA